MTDLRATNVMVQIRHNSRISCSLLCLQSENCDGFNYNKATRECETVAPVFNTGPVLRREIGWSYYQHT